MPLFPVNRALLRPQFEAYRLASGETPAQHSHKLPIPAATPGNDASLGYKELKARAMHNALTPLPDSAIFAYLDSERYVTLVSLQEPIQFQRVFRVEHYVTMCAMDASTLVVCDGSFLSHLAIDASTLQADHISYAIPSFELHSDDHALSWRIVSASHGSILLERARRKLSSSVTPGLGANSGTQHSQSQTSFDVLLVRDKQLVWHMTSEEPVSYAFLGESSLIGSEASLGPAKSDAMKATPTPAADTPLYSWTQTDDTLTLAFALPASINKLDIRVHFSHKGLSLGLAAPAAKITDLDAEPEPHSQTEEALRNGSFESRALWDIINVDESVWTWEHVQTRTGSETRVLGLLTLHIAKKHEGTRWPTVLEGDDTAETLDPSELLMMLEGLEKYTEAPGQSSLLRDGLEEEDALAGTKFVLTEVHADGSIVRAEPSDSAMLLAGPAPCSTVQTGLLLKHDVDGIVYSPPSSPSLAVWSPVELVPAISYVLASKREAHPVYFLRVPNSSSSCVFALEPRNNTIHGKLGYNVFVYHAAPKSNYGESRVLRLENDEQRSGSLLGLAVTSDARLLCLFDTALHVVENALFT